MVTSLTPPAWSVPMPRIALRGCAASLLLAIAGLQAQAPPPSGFPGTAPRGPQARIVTFAADDSSIDSGGTTTLRWAAINAYSLTIEPGIGAVPIRGSLQVSPTATTTFRLTATGPQQPDVAELTIAVSGSHPTNGMVPDSGPRVLPTLSDGRPDLSGVYLGGRDIRLVGEIELAAGGHQYRVEQQSDDLGLGSLCLPPGVPGATMMPFPLQIIHKPDVIAILYEAYNLFRIIPIGIPQSDDVDATWMGHSVAHWNGDTLTIDVVGFNDLTRIAGFRHTRQMHVTETLHRTEDGEIDYAATVEDSNVFATPLEFRGKLIPHPEWRIGEYICAENNKNYRELFEP